MVYIISSTTPWPAKKENSINLLYEFQKASDLIAFGEYVISFSKKKGYIVIENQGSTIYNEKLEEISRKYENGDTIEGPLFSSFTINDNNLDLYKDYTNRAINFYELFEGTNKDNTWHNLEKMIQLALTQKKTEIDALFIRASFFPKKLLTNLDDFFKTLFSILYEFSSETFVIIIDVNISSIYNYIKTYSKKIYIDDSLHPQLHDISSNKYYEDVTDFIFRINNFVNKNQTFHVQKTHAFCLVDNNSLYMFQEIYNDAMLTKEFNEYKEQVKFYFNEIDERALINRFERFINRPKLKIKDFNLYKYRLKQQLKESQNFNVRFIPYRALKKFLNTYFGLEMDNPEVQDFLFCFQRLHVVNDKYKKPFEVALLGNQDICTWSKLYTKMYKFFPANSQQQNNPELDNIETLKDKTAYYCGVKKREPENNEGLKEFIFQACVCSSLSIQTTESILHKYGFAIVDFSKKDYLYKYLINYNPKTQKFHNQNDRQKIIASLYIELQKILN